MKENLEKEKCFKAMDESFENFIDYLIAVNNDTLHIPEDESESEKSFRDGLVRDVDLFTGEYQKLRILK